MLSVRRDPDSMGGAQGSTAHSTTRRRLRLEKFWRPEIDLLPPSKPPRATGHFPFWTVRAPPRHPSRQHRERHLSSTQRHHVNPRYGRYVPRNWLDQPRLQEHRDFRAAYISSPSLSSLLKVLYNLLVCQHPSVALLVYRTNTTPPPGTQRSPGWKSRGLAVAGAADRERHARASALGGGLEVISKTRHRCQYSYPR